MNFSNFINDLNLTIILNRIRIDLACGLTLLTRLPVSWLFPSSASQISPLPFARSLWCWSLIGIAIGGFTGSVLSFLESFHTPSFVAACCALSAQALLTGAIHEDGLADMADGFGGVTPEKRLTIMRDSHIGSYGVIALCLSYGIRCGALMVFSPLIVPLVCGLTGGLARMAMVFIPAWLPPARTNGLASTLFPLPRHTFIQACWLFCLTYIVLTIILTLIIPFSVTRLLFILTLPLLTASAGVCLLAYYARHYLGGYTGDVLGSCVVITECLVLTLFSAMLS